MRDRLRREVKVGDKICRATTIGRSTADLRIEEVVEIGEFKSGYPWFISKNIEGDGRGDKLSGKLRSPYNIIVINDIYP